MSDLDKELNMNEEKFGLAEQLEHTVSVMCDETTCPEMPLHPESGFAIDLRAAAVAVRERDALAARVEQLEAAIGDPDELRWHRWHCDETGNGDDLRELLVRIADALEAVPVPDPRPPAFMGQSDLPDRSDRRRQPVDLSHHVELALPEPPAERPECPTCGSDDPAFRGSLTGWTCADPFHTPPSTEETQ